MSADDDMPSDAQVRAAAERRATHPQEPHGGGALGLAFTYGIGHLFGTAIG